MYLTHDKTTTKEFDTLTDATKTGLPVFVPLDEYNAALAGQAALATQNKGLLDLAQATADTVSEAVKAKADAKAELAAEKAKGKP